MTLTADGDQTTLVLEQRGTPLDLLAAYGAGSQLHVEDLVAHLAGRERCAAGVWWDDLRPASQDLAAGAGQARAAAGPVPAPAASFWPANAAPNTGIDPQEDGHGRQSA